ncbi:hypothetical protein WH47_03529 [Habropoda laboriosa]|uniref:Uncharacterized protein n=1 Tax=Habropoda laboriosa TaxID=597456 RepID=A0A0L7RCB0_9HYME|nr:hypothetical protein WH47_03529 [Habropoda laboriosa]
MRKTHGEKSLPEIGEPRDEEFSSLIYRGGEAAMKSKRGLQLKESEKESREESGRKEEERVCVRGYLVPVQLALLLSSESDGGHANKPTIEDHPMDRNVPLEQVALDLIDSRWYLCYEQGLDNILFIRYILKSSAVPTKLRFYADTLGARKTRDTHGVHLWHDD